MPTESTSAVVGAMWVLLDSQSTATQMVLNPWLSGSPTIKSVVTTCQHQSGIALGLSLPTGAAG